MKNLCKNRNTGGRAGFTIVELVVAITVLGILCAAVAVSWSSFMRYQELRDSANTFHKELLALKARALQDSAVITISCTAGTEGSSCNAVWMAETDDGTPNPRNVSIPLNKNVTIANNFNTGEDGLPSSKIDKNGWASGIDILPNNLDAFTSGRLKISSPKSPKKSFCIVKDSISIKPELYYQSGSGGTWKKM